MHLSKKGVVCLFSLMLLVSCTKSDINTKLSRLLFTEIVIPHDGMNRIGNLCNNDTCCNDSMFTLLTYIDNNSCSQCELHEILSTERVNRHSELWPKLNKIYIFNPSTESYKDICSMLCNKKIDGEIFLDSCGIFCNCNPQLPKRKIFHTLVLDANNRVILVGNPFRNQKLCILLKEIIIEEPFKNE